MKKTLLLLISFLLLGVGAWWFSKEKTTNTSRTLGWDVRFKVEDPDDIHKIFIAKRTGHKTTLERKGKGWVYDGKYPVRPTAIANLLETISTVRMKYIPPGPAVESIVKNLATRGIKVEIYNKAGENLKTYYVGEMTSDERGTYMIMEGAEQPYVVELPLLEGQIRIRYEMIGDSWRDRTVFRAEVEDIESVTMEYPLQKNKSFRLERKGNEYAVKPFYDITQEITRPLSKGAGEAFLTGFESIVAEAFENGQPESKKDSIRNTIPFVVITIEQTDGKRKQAALYPRSTTDPFGNVVAQTVERYWADVVTEHGSDFMLVQQLVFAKILWAYDFFFEKPSSANSK